MSNAKSYEQALLFELGGQRYCMSLEDISEIVERPKAMTTLPNSPPHIEGVVDLRGMTMQVINPKSLLNIPEEK